MELKQIEMWLQVMPCVAAFLLFTLIIRLQASYHPEKLFLKRYEEFSGMLRKRSSESTWYQRTERWLVRYGGCVHYGKWLNPVRYLTLRLLLAVLAVAALSEISIPAGVTAAGILFFLPGLLLVYLNGRDNEKMLPEIKLVFHALEIQIRAGVYITDALAECYGSVRENRLRCAFLELAGDIVMKADIYEALDHFQLKFDNRYIDSLCITIFQALESGQAVELLSDIGEQVKDMEANVLERRKNALDRSITFYQLGVLVAVLGVALYACVTNMFAAAAGF